MPSYCQRPHTMLLLLLLLLLLLQLSHIKDQVGYANAHAVAD